MKANTSFIRPFLTLIVLAVFAVACKEDDLAGPAGAASKPFNLVMGKLQSTVAYSLTVSADGTKVLAGVNNSVNPVLHYSQDGGMTFTAVSDVAQNRIKYPVSISNQGLVQTQDGKLYSINGTQVTTSPNFGNTIIAGDNGKIFAYSVNDGVMQYITSTDATIKPIAPPIEVKPGSAFNYSMIKAKGKGIIFIASPITRADKTIGFYLLDETTMTWSTHSASITWSKINGCNNLNVYERFSYGMNNTLIVKGCTGAAIVNLTGDAATYVTYPVIENVVYETLRDGEITVDTKGTLYLTAGPSYDAVNIYMFKDSKWTNLENFLPNVSGFSLDGGGNIFYNSIKAEGTIIKSPVKINIQSGTKTVLNLPREEVQIVEAMVTGEDVVFVADQQLLKYDVKGNSLSRFNLKGISDFNILSDGRWTAGGNDVIYLSSDNGNSWTETKKVFSSAAPSNGPLMVVLTTRIVNGQVLVWGVYTYNYYNSTLGANQIKRDNIVVALNGGKQDYQLIADFAGSAISPDGTLYGYADFASFSGGVRDFYEIKPATAPLKLSIRQAPSPMVVTEDGVHMTISSSTSGAGYQVYTRKNVGEEWTPVGADLPGSTSSYEWMKLRSSGSSLTFIAVSEIYKAGD